MYVERKIAYYELTASRKHATTGLWWLTGIINWSALIKNVARITEIGTAIWTFRFRAERFDIFP